MDIVEAPSLLGPPPGDEPAKVGRPPIGAMQRAMSDQKYQATVDMMEAMPASVMELRFRVFDGNPRTRQKDSFNAREEILLSKFKDMGFKDEDTLRAYIQEKHGDGFYIVEAFDAHNMRLDKIPPIRVKAGDFDMDDEFDDDDRARPRRQRSRGSWRDRDGWDDDEDPRDARANTADLMSTVSRQQTAQVTQVAKSSQDMMTMLMMSNQQAAETRAAEDRRREEQRAEERKREETRAEERRREQEQERKEERDREERRREEQRSEQRRDDDRRALEQRALMEAANKKTELLLGVFTAAIPVVQKMFEPKKDEMLPILLSNMNKPPDPMLSVLLQSILAKANDPGASGLMLQQMMEMSKLSGGMMAEQFKGMMSMSSEMQNTVMKRALDMMMSSPQGQTPEGKSMIEQVMGILGAAADIVKPFMTAPAPAALPAPARQARAVQHTPAQPATTPQGMTPAGPVTPAVPMTPDGRPIALKHPNGVDKTAAELHWESLTPEQQAAEAQDAPKGTKAVLACLKSIHTQQFGNQNEYQQLIGYMVDQMPLDLRVAVLDNDEIKVAMIVTPVAKAEAELWTWLTLPETQTVDGPKPSTLDWIRQFVQSLPPSIEAIHGPADAQRAQLASDMPDQPATVPVEAVADVAAEAPPAAAAEATPLPTGEAAPIIPGPGSIAAELPSHLTPDPDAP